MIEILKKNKNIILHVFVVFVAIYLLFPSFYEIHLYPMPAIPEQTWMTLDPSWVLTLNYANIKSLSWGDQFVFTYGPLGYLSTRLGWGVNKYSLFIYDLFVSFNFLFLFLSLYKTTANRWFIIGFISLVILILPNYISGGNSIILFAFFVFWLNKIASNTKWYYFLPAVALLVIMFYMKFNTGLISLILYYMVLGYVMLKNKRVIIFQVSIFAFAPLLFIYFLASSLKVNLIDYVYNGLELVRGYNQIMYLSEDNGLYLVLALSLIVFVLASFLILFIKEKHKNIFYNVLVFILITTPLFVLFKQAFVRADFGHLKDFFIYFPVFMLVIFPYMYNKFKVQIIPVFLISFAVSLYIINPNFKESIFIKIDKSEYVIRFNNFGPVSGLKIFSDQNKYPERILNEIKNSTVDTYPWNSYILFENELNFTPRPVFQSYTAYTRDLQNLNFNHYNSERAPNYLVYDFLSIDNRYPLFDEPKLNLSIIKNYKVVDTFTVQGRKNVLLEKKNNYKPINFIKTREFAIYLGGVFIPEKDMFYEFEIYNSILGKLVSIFNHAPEVSLVIRTDKAGLKEFKTSEELLKSGVFSNTFIENTTDFLTLFQDEYYSNLNKIEFYKIVPNNHLFFKDKVKVTEYKITQ